MKLISILACWAFACFIAWRFIKGAGDASARCALGAKDHDDDR